MREIRRRRRPQALAGVFYCRVHPFMKGKFWVIGGSLDALPIAP